MEWVEFTARTLEEAKDLALDRLGVAADDAEFEILAEPKPGLFGRLRGEARVRARVRPAQARQKVDRRDRRPRKSEGAEGATKTAKPKTQSVATKSASKPVAKTAPKPAAAAPRTDRENGDGRENGETTSPPSKEQQEVNARQVGDEARKFIDELVTAFAFTGTTELIEDGDDLEIRVHGENLGLLVGPRGTTLQAVQDLARVASQRRLGDHDTRLRVDIGGYRQRRKEALDRFALQMADEVKQSGVARVLEPMSSADRKIVHDALSEVEGIGTRSEGDDPYRRVVITPAND
ncbi:MAG TPA: RNA-binding cell elongation regulator Jag/EloR [Ilumatobacteraceae bacterium]|jgi:spoIIIJ-associated protein|nr:RNA-binding cell elongation regulator Jag/EloR [Ilumatobacteraceae bacterium]